MEISEWIWSSIQQDAKSYWQITIISITDDRTYRRVDIVCVCMSVYVVFFVMNSTLNIMIAVWQPNDESIFSSINNCWWCFSILFLILIHFGVFSLLFVLSFSFVLCNVHDHSMVSCLCYGSSFVHVHSSCRSIHLSSLPCNFHFIFCCCCYCCCCCCFCCVWNYERCIPAGIPAIIPQFTYASYSTITDM